MLAKLIDHSGSNGKVVIQDNQESHISSKEKTDLVYHFT